MEDFRAVTELDPSVTDPPMDFSNLPDLYDSSIQAEAKETSISASDVKEADSDKDPMKGQVDSFGTTKTPHRKEKMNKVDPQLKALLDRLSVTGDPMKSFDLPPSSEDEFEPKTMNAIVSDVDDENVEVRQELEDKNEEDSGSVNQTVAPQTVKPVQVRKAIVDVLPEELLKRESDAWLYPRDNASVYGTLRGADTPKTKEIQMPGGRDASKVAPAVFTFWKIDRSSEAIGHVGSFRRPGPNDIVAGLDQRCAEISWIMHSQVPGVKFYIRRDATHTAEVIIHANSLRRYIQDGETVVGWAMRTSRDPAMKSAFLHPNVRLSNLWELRIGLPFPDEPPTLGPEFRRPDFISGVTQQELNDMKETVVSSQCSFGDLTILSPGDWILYGLDTQYEFSVYRVWWETKVAQEAFTIFNNWFTTAMKDCAINGNFPHYARQAHKQGKIMNQDDLDMGVMVPPQHLVKKWSVTFEDDKPVDCKAEQWERYLYLTHYPDPATALFAQVIDQVEEGGRNFDRASCQALKKSHDEFNQKEASRYRFDMLFYRPKE